MNDSPSRSRSKWWLGAFALAASLVMAILWLCQPQLQRRVPEPNSSEPASMRVGEKASSAPVGPSEERIVSAAIDALSKAAGPGAAGAAHRALAQLRAELGSLPPQAVAALLVQTLDSRVDAATGQDLAVGPDGSLKSSPSLRVFLLDYLAQVDPKAASAYAERVLQSFTAADEWAVSLRNYARVNDSPQGRAFLQQKLEAMLRHEGWRKEPSAGFLEAFDVAEFIGGTGLLAVLGELVREQDNRATAHAAYLALDRLVIQQPATVLAELQRQPELMEGREQTRANYFARADVSDAAQRAVLENYLLDSTRTTAELETFAGLFPSANFMISHNLLTRTATPDGAILAARDAAALRVVSEWLAEPRFAERRAQLEQMHRRLEGFVRQSSR